MVRLDRLALEHVGLGDQPVVGRGQLDDRWRIAGLAAFHAEEHLAFLDAVAQEGIDLDGTSGNAGGNRVLVAGDFLDATDREDGGFEIALLDHHGFKAQVFDSGFVEDDRVGGLGGIEGFLCGHGGSDEETVEMR